MCVYHGQGVLAAQLFGGIDVCGAGGFGHALFPVEAQSEEKR